MAVRVVVLPLWLVTTVPTGGPASSSVKFTRSPAPNPRSAIPNGAPASTASGTSTMLGRTATDARDLAPLDRPTPSTACGPNGVTGIAKVAVPLPFPATATVPTEVELLDVL